MKRVWLMVMVAFFAPATAQDRTLAVASRAEATEHRVALVIGNSQYKIGPLRNPGSDARAMAAALRKAGFEVTLRENLSQRGLFEAARDFGSKLRVDSVALFYYAGHGLQVRDRNFLIPVEADMQNEEEVPYSSLDVHYVLDVMSRSRSRFNVVILDACRNNPFGRSFRSASRGLAQMDAPGGTLLAYATAPGRVASDGTGENGLYTQHLLRHLLTPGLPVEILFKRVREGVEQETKSQQIPWESSSLKGDFYFVGAPASSAVVPAAQPSFDSAFAAELAFWDAIKNTTNAKEYESYLEQYPKGKFAALARIRMEALPVKPMAPVASLASAPASAPAAPAKAASNKPPAPVIPATQVASLAPSTVAWAAKAPTVGSSWTYRYTNLWKPDEKVDVTHTIAELNEDRVREHVTRAGDKVSVEWSDWRAGARMRDWQLGEIVMREFFPFASASELAKVRQPITDVKGLAAMANRAEWSVSAAVRGEEQISVPAGRFRAVKVFITGSRPIAGWWYVPVRFEMTVWYAPEMTRYVRMAYTSHSARDVLSRDIYELVAATAAR